MSIESSKNERPPPSPPLELSELPKPFRSQVKKMEKFREKARVLGNKGMEERWDEKIQNLVGKINTDTRAKKIDEKILSKIRLKQVKKAVKSVRWLTNWLFKGIIHPSIALMNTKALSKANPKEVMNSDVSAYLDTPLLSIDFADGKYITSESINRPQAEIDQRRKSEHDQLSDPEDRQALSATAEVSKPYMGEIREKGKQVLASLQAGDTNKKIPFEDFKKAMQKEFPYRSSLLGDARVDFAKADQKFQELLTETPKRAERLYFYTSTYDQLDGAVIYPKRKPEIGQEWKNPTLIFVGGNSSFFEHQVEQAQELSDRYDINVVIYNGPGVGLSMGKERGEKDVIDAFQGVYTAVNERLKNDKGVPNQDKIGVIGHSLGGGISAVGLGHLAKEGVIEGEQKPGLYINYHSFSSLSRVVANARSGSDWILRQFIKMMGIGNMNAARSLQKRAIAKKVVLVSTDQDAIMKKYGQLAKDVERLQKKGVKFANEEIRIVAAEPLNEQEHGKHVGMIAHNDLGALTQKRGDVANALEEWAKRPR